MKVEQEKIGPLTSGERESLGAIAGSKNRVTHAFDETFGEIEAGLVVFDNQNAHRERSVSKR